MPIVAYNLRFDLEEVLQPEWTKWGLKAFGAGGFCALRLAQRLLDPVPAGNCKLQTLRQYYRLPERGAHTALGDVQTVVDLVGRVLKPLAAARRLETWEELKAFADEEWYPSRIAFGKFKGRDFRDASIDTSLRGWIEWLAGSSNPRTAAMGRWYLSQLQIAKDGAPRAPLTFDVATEASESIDLGPRGVAIALYVNPELEDLRRLISAARLRLADLEATYTGERHAVDVTRAALFRLLHQHYLERDRLRLIVKYRRRYLEILLTAGEDQAEEVRTEYRNAKTQTEADYEEAAQLAQSQKQLTDDEQAELKGLWRKLVRIYHPDRFAGDPEKRATYEKLTALINRARDEGNIGLLRDIANDPTGFIARQGWGSFDFQDDAELNALRRLLESLQLRILDVIAQLDELHEHPDYELHRLCADSAVALEEIADGMVSEIRAEITELEAEAESLRKEIDALAEGKVIGD